MKKPGAVRITVSNPCTENWDDMSPEGKGRFCANCKKTIIDFSNLSEPELYRLFSNDNSIACGRFHNDQLNKRILPATPPNRFSKNLSRAAAALFAFASLESASAGESQKNITTTVQLPIEKNPQDRTAGGYIISGQVQDTHGNLLENAKISVGDSVLAVTGKDGNFEFRLDDNTNPFIFQVHFPGLAPVARNYHPAMASTHYNIVLGALLSPDYYQGGYTMGIMMVDTTNMPSISIQLPAKNSLSKETKDRLSELAVWMRNNPEIGIILNTYISRTGQSVNAKKIQSAIKKFLEDHEGIDISRVKEKLMKVDGVGQGIVEINSCGYGDCN